MVNGYNGRYNGTEAYQIGTRYLIVDSFTGQAQGSCHIFPNSFMADISQLTSSLKMFWWRYHEYISSFSIKVGICAIT